MHLESANVLQLQFVGGSTEIAAELRNRADVGSLCRWRKIADGHVLDHAVAQRAHLGHLEISCLGAGCNTRSSQTGGQLSDLAARAAIAASFNPATNDSPLSLDIRLAKETSLPASSSSLLKKSWLWL